MRAAVLGNQVHGNVGAPWTLLATVQQFGHNTSTPIDTRGSNLIVIGCSGTLAGSFSDSEGNTWTQLTTYSAFGGAFGNARFYYCVNPNVGASHTFSGFVDASDTFIVTAWAATGTPSFDAENGSGDGVTSQGSYQGGSVTPSQDRCLVLSVLTVSGAGGADTAISVNDGFTKVGEQLDGTGKYGASVAYLAQGLAAAINPTWVYSGNGFPAAGIAVFKN